MTLLGHLTQNDQRDVPKCMALFLAMKLLGRRSGMFGFNKCLREVFNFSSDCYA